MKIAFLGLKPWEEEYVKKSLPADAETVFFSDNFTKDHLPEQKDFTVISGFVDSVLDKEVLGAFPWLQFIATRSTGFDHIDLDYCKAKNIIVSTVPSYGENTVAEHAFGLLLCLAHKIYEGFDRIKETGDFDFEGLQGFDLKGKTLGVLGTGRIGQHAVRIAKGFEMNVLAYDPFPKTELASSLGFSYESFEAVLAKSDIISIHIPYTTENHHLFNEKNISLMKKGAYLINTSRGGIVETPALVKALKEGHLGGAGLDVLEEEGFLKDELDLFVKGRTGEHDLQAVLANHILFDMPNVIVTPHNAFNTREALQRILETTIENILAFIKGASINTVK